MNREKNEQAKKEIEKTIKQIPLYEYYNKYDSEITMIAFYRLKRQYKKNFVRKIIAKVLDKSPYSQ